MWSELAGLGYIGSVYSFGRLENRLHYYQTIIVRRHPGVRFEQVLRVLVLQD